MNRVVNDLSGEQWAALTEAWGGCGDRSVEATWVSFVAVQSR
jgi:hypothetical protein